MNEHQDLIYGNILRDMAEGMMTIGLDGVIGYVNPAAEAIFEREKAELEGRAFARVFVLGAEEENDEFVQTVLDAVYDPDARHEALVPFRVGDREKQLTVMTSFIKNGPERVGVAAVISDVTELYELKARYAQQITVMMDSLVKALSEAIDERSHYTGNHTQNMVRIAEAFLDWLERTGNPWRFDETRRRAFLLSVGLHDVGKLTVPLEIMDKATRLGDQMAEIEKRFEKIHLLSRVSLLEGRLSREEYAAGERERAALLAFVRRINAAGFLADEDLTRVQSLAGLTCETESGAKEPLFTKEELQNLSIRKGTLNDEERAQMRGHVTSTRQILSEVAFPEMYSMVPAWASAHHELLNGTGYPDHLRGEEIPREARLLTVLDVFEALTARDRPYKKPMPLERAWAILDGMAKEGSVDAEILALFRESGAWKSVLPGD